MPNWYMPDLVYGESTLLSPAIDFIVNAVQYDRLHYLTPVDFT